MSDVSTVAVSVHAPLPAATAASRLNPVYALAEGAATSAETRETHRTSCQSSAVQTAGLDEGKKPGKFVSHVFSVSTR